MVALPIGLHTVLSRLLSGYYRQPAAINHDIDTIAHNAADFNGEDSKIAAEARGGTSLWPCSAILRAGGGCAFAYRGVSVSLRVCMTLPVSGKTYLRTKLCLLLLH